MTTDKRTTWQIQVTVFATREQADDLTQRIERLLCPDPDHRSPCPAPWFMSHCTVPRDDFDLSEQYILEYLLEQIRSGTLRPGQALPSQARLARDHGVSRERVRKAIAKLGEGGLVETVRGRGTFVRPVA
jgi:hypothetical protein